MKVKIEEIQFVGDLYPRDGFDNETVNNYKTNVDKLPPITITKEKILVDGYHRLVAHKLAELVEIEVEIIDIPRDRVLLESTKLNAKHGKQLTRTEKKALARKFYESGIAQNEIADALAVSPSILSDYWLGDLIQEAREEQKNTIIELYLQCLTQEEIANKVGLTHGRVAQIVNKFKTEEINKINLVPESLQLFNVWNFSHRDTKAGLDFEGAIPAQLVENTLYYFTKPFDVIVDPMAGSGTTIDVCKRLFRRYLAYDLKPKRADIKQNDVRQGFPKEANNADFIFLDPPYFNMVFKDLFASIEDFKEFLHQLAKESYDKLRQDGYVAILMQDMTELGNYVLSGDVFCTFVSHGFQPEAHISCPLTTEQFLPQQITKAKETKHLLGRNRDLYIFKK